MTNLKLHLWLLLALVGAPMGLPGQESILESYVAEGLDKNLALKRKALSYEKSLYALKEAKGLFFPSLAFNASYTLASGGRLIEFPIGDLFNPVYATLNQLTESQSFPTNLENEDIQFLPNNFHDTKTTLTQPLFNTDIYFNYKAQKALIEVERVSQEVYRLELIKEIQTAYLGYLQSMEAIEILEDTRILLQEVKRVNQKLVNSQKATKEVILQTDFELSDVEQQKASLEESRQGAQAYFNFLLNRPLEEAIETDSLLLSLSINGSLEELTAQAVAVRPEIDQLTKAQEANEWNIRRHQYANLPKVGAALDAGFQGFGYNLGDNQAYFLAGFSLNWDLFKAGQNSARKQQAILDQQQLFNQKDEVKKQIELQLRQSFYATKAAASKEKSSRLALTSAKESYRILNKKYLNQQASFLEFLQAQNQLTRARLDLNLSHFEYLSKVAELSYASGKYR
ncbi:MAG: TolC family protein [Bacteroidia bacterium]|nr:TolC family protein [Bacteroidia bacterium]